MFFINVLRDHDIILFPNININNIIVNAINAVNSINV